MFKNKILLITGGTGSFGNAVIERIIQQDINEIRIFSRDEKKQDDLRKKYSNKKLKFYIGDVRDFQSVQFAMNNVDFVFHAAALKQVPSCEFYPLEAVKTNILGTENVLESAILKGVKKIVCLSTDKAVYPINSMGMSKAMMEKIAIAKSRIESNTSICITRYGNVMGSRGSVIPIFLEQFQKKIPFTITDPNMTRFMMTLDEAVDLVFYAFNNGTNGDIFVQKSPASTIIDLLEALKIFLKVDSYKVNIIGTRHGEKLYEVLLSREEMTKAIDLGKYYRIPPDLRDLNYEKFINLGQMDITNSKEYTSHNTHRLGTKDLLNLIKISLENINQ